MQINDIWGHIPDPTGFNESFVFKAAESFAIAAASKGQFPALRAAAIFLVPGESILLRRGLAPGILGYKRITSLSTIKA